MNNMIELTYLKDDDFGRMVYKGDNGKKYVEVDGQIHDMTKDGEPNTPIRNVKIKSGEPIYQANVRTTSKPVKDRLKMEHLQTFESFSNFNETGTNINEAKIKLEDPKKSFFYKASTRIEIYNELKEVLEDNGGDADGLEEIVKDDKFCQRYVDKMMKIHMDTDVIDELEYAAIIFIKTDPKLKKIAKNLNGKNVNEALSGSGRAKAVEVFKNLHDTAYNDVIQAYDTNRDDAEMAAEAIKAGIEKALDELVIK